MGEKAIKKLRRNFIIGLKYSVSPILLGISFYVPNFLTMKEEKIMRFQKSLSIVVIGILTLCLLVVPTAANYNFDGYPVETKASGTVDGGVYIDYEPWAGTTTLTGNFDVPNGDVKWARLYVGIWGGTENYEGWVNVTLNGIYDRNELGSIHLQGNNDVNPNVWCSTHGKYWMYYNVTDLVNAGSTNTATTSKINATVGSFDGRVYGIVLAVVYEGGDKPKDIQYWINDGSDALNYVTPHNNGTTYFDGDVFGSVTDAKLTVVHLTGYDPSCANCLEFNEHELDTSMVDSNTFELNTWDVTSYVASSGNNAWYRRGEDPYVNVCNAILTLESGPTPTPTPAPTPSPTPLPPLEVPLEPGEYKMNFSVHPGESVSKELVLTNSRDFSAYNISHTPVEGNASDLIMIKPEIIKQILPANEETFKIIVFVPEDQELGNYTGHSYFFFSSTGFPPPMPFKIDFSVSVVPEEVKEIYGIDLKIDGQDEVVAKNVTSNETASSASFEITVKNTGMYFDVMRIEEPAWEEEEGWDVRLCDEAKEVTDFPHGILINAGKEHYLMLNVTGTTPGTNLTVEITGRSSANLTKMDSVRAITYIKPKEEVG